jgi:hypothetical protein
VALGQRVKDYLSSKADGLRPETKVWLSRMKASWDEVL